MDGIYDDLRECDLVGGHDAPQQKLKKVQESVFEIVLSFVRPH